MSKVFFTLSFPHDNPVKPKFSIGINNLYGIDVVGTDIRGAKVGNGNLNKGYRNRFEYSFKTQKGVSSVNLILNTSAVLPHLSWVPGDGEKKKEVIVEPINPRKPSNSHRRLRERERDDSYVSERPRRRRESQERDTVRFAEPPRRQPQARRIYSPSSSSEDEHDRRRSSRPAPRHSRNTREELWMANDNNSTGADGTDD